MAGDRSNGNRSNEGKTEMHFYHFMSFINDYGFKKLFGEERSKPLLIHFLNSLLAGEIEEITDVVLLNNERLGVTKEQRGIVYDVYCKDDKQARYIIEMQLGSQAGFVDRSVYYASSAFLNTVDRGQKWYKAKPVFFIALLDFDVPFVDSFENQDVEDDYIHWCQIADRKSHRILYDKFTFIFIELKRFKTAFEDLDSALEHWLYLIYNMSKWEDIPERYINHPTFAKAFEIADLALMNKDERTAYELSWSARSDMLGLMEENHMKGLKKGLEKGLAKGRQEGRQEVQKALITKLKAKGFTPSEIAELVDLSAEEKEPSP